MDGEYGPRSQFCIKGGYLDFSYLTELKNYIYNSLKFM